jgi:hypothetical protein
MRKILSILFILIGLVMLVSGLSSSKFDISALSYPDMFFLAALLVGSSYLLYSLTKPRLLAVNNAVLAPVLITGILIELMLRSCPSLVPLLFLVDLPRNDARQIAEQRGLLTRNTLIGEGMLYHYKPHQMNKAWTYLRIDSLGYRNPNDNIEGYVDAVLLGDSMILAQESEIDLGELFRKSGMSALNLGMGGYAPQHYRDAYKKLIIERKIRNAYTLIFLFAGNDFEDAARYETTRSMGGSWKDYVERNPPARLYQDYLPWTINSAMGLPRYVKGIIENPSRPIKLPYRSITVRYLWWPPRINPGDKEWQIVRAALEELINLSKANSAVPILFLIPSPATLYSQFDGALKKWDDHYQATARTIQDFASGRNVPFVDLNDPLRRKMKRDFILVSQWDCHFNARGITELFNIVFQRVREWPRTSAALGWTETIG